MSPRAVDQAVLEQKPGEPDLPLNQARFQNGIEWSDSLLARARELVAHRELLFLVAQREIKVRYRQTALGVLWAILQPFSLMLVFTALFSGFIRMPSEGAPYPIFSYAALLPWMFFSTSLSFATPSLINNSNLITRVYFPREIVPLSSIAAALVDFLVASGLLLGMLAFYQIKLDWVALYTVPVLAVQIVFTAGVCLFLSALTVVYRDARFTIPLIVQLWMFATPVFYPVSVVPDHLRAVYMAVNPMAVIIDGYRNALIQGQPPDLKHLSATALVSLSLLVLAYKYFKHQEKFFADIV